MVLTDLQEEVLSGLVSFARTSPDTWARPMDVGGRDGSGHGPCLFRLSNAGLCERRTYAWTGGRRINKYKPNKATYAALASHW